MNANRFARATFECTVAESSQLPPPNGTEVAFAGRSNAGKSSAINALTNRRALAYVARAPGKTRTIQFYRLDAGSYLVDLPGYGYARVADAIRTRWVGLLQHYLNKRPSLAGLVLIMDVRHPLTPLDERLLGWYLPRKRPLHVLLSKVDKVSRASAFATLRRIEDQLAGLGPARSVQLFSSSRGDGIEQAQEVIDRWFVAHPADQVSPGEQEIRTPG